MPRISDFALLERPEQYALAITHNLNSAEQLPSLIGGGYQQLAAYLEELGELLTDNPYVAYRPKGGSGFSMENGFSAEIGFTVIRPFPAKGEILPLVIPARKEASCMYLGPYLDMAPVYGEMMGWMAAKNLRGSGAVYEFYYNGPDTQPEHYLTKIVMPLA